MHWKQCLQLLRASQEQRLSPHTLGEMGKFGSVFGAVLAVRTLTAQRAFNLEFA
jgi:hypothetical protein